MKKLICILTVIFISTLQCNAHYDMTTPVEGASLANDELQFLVIKSLYKTLGPRTPTCSDFSIYNTQLLHYPYDVKKDKHGKYIKGYWKELWTVNACGEKSQFPVTFTIKKKNTTFLIDSYFLE